MYLKEDERSHAQFLVQVKSVEGYKNLQAPKKADRERTWFRVDLNLIAQKGAKGRCDRIFPWNYGGEVLNFTPQGEDDRIPEVGEFLLLYVGGGQGSSKWNEFSSSPCTEEELSWFDSEVIKLAQKFPSTFGTGGVARRNQDKASGYRHKCQMALAAAESVLKEEDFDKWIRKYPIQDQTWMNGYKNPVQMYLNEMLPGILGPGHDNFHICKIYGVSPVVKVGEVHIKQPQWLEKWIETHGYLYPSQYLKEGPPPKDILDSYYSALAEDEESKMEVKEVLQEASMKIKELQEEFLDIQKMIPRNEYEEDYKKFSLGEIQDKIEKIRGMIYDLED
jgi:hypothetical protein